MAKRKGKKPNKLKRTPLAKPSESKKSDDALFEPFEFEPLDLSQFEKDFTEINELLKEWKLSDFPEWKPGEIEKFTRADLTEFFPGIELTFPESAPPPIVGKEGERKGTVDDVAKWMRDAMTERSELYQRDAAYEIIDRFGGGFLYKNRNKNYGIDSDVLKAFRALSIKDVVWVKKRRYWRQRRESDPPGRRQVDDE